jgi:hypothetical protein
MATRHPPAAIDTSAVAGGVVERIRRREPESVRTGPPPCAIGQCGGMVMTGDHASRPAARSRHLDDRWPDQ